MPALRDGRAARGHFVRFTGALGGVGVVDIGGVGVGVVDIGGVGGASRRSPLPARPERRSSLLHG
ncbi:hypothetical protein [Streptomyces sp. NPDC054849]